MAFSHNTLRLPFDDIQYITSLMPKWMILWRKNNVDNGSKRAIMSVRIAQPMQRSPADTPGPVYVRTAEHATQEAMYNGT